MGVWPCGRVGVCLVVGWAMRSVKKTRVKLFRLWVFRRGDPVEKLDFFDWICQSEFSVEKSWVEKALFRLCKKVWFGLQSKKAVFDWQIRLYKKWPSLLIVPWRTSLYKNKLRDANTTNMSLHCTPGARNSFTGRGDTAKNTSWVFTVCCYVLQPAGYSSTAVWCLCQHNRFPARLILLVPLQPTAVYRLQVRAVTLM